VLATLWDAGKTGRIYPDLNRRISMSLRSKDTAIDEIVASCNGDLRGAVRALLLINEHLETELAKAYAAAVDRGLAERSGNVLH
jgi:hypothetical protein